MWSSTTETVEEPIEEEEAEEAEKKEDEEKKEVCINLIFHNCVIPCFIIVLPSTRYLISRNIDHFPLTF